MDIFKNFNVTRSEGKLKNGIKVVLFHRAGAPVATTAILDSGSKYDPETMPGVTHFLEHMVVNGSLEFPTKDLLAEHIESVGGTYSAATWQDSMRINTEVSDKSDYDRVANIFNATLCNPLMDKDVFENEKKVVIKEIQRSNSNPSQILIKTLRQLFFKGTPFEHQILGDEESILKLQYEEVISEYKKLFDASRITFVVSGDISIDEVVTKLNTLHFLKGSTSVSKNDQYEMIDKKLVLASFFDAPQTHLYFGVPAPVSFTEDLLHLNLLGQILAGGRTSRLTKRLRYEKGLVYAVSFSKNGGQKFGAWGITTDTSEDKVQEVVDEIMAEIKDLQINGVKESELEFVKNKRIKSLKRTMQTSDDWVDFHALSEAFSKETWNIDTFVKDTEETTVEDIKRVIDIYMPLDKWQLALCGRTKAQDIKIS
jgi:zinc protease